MKLHGSGFIVSHAKARSLGLGIVKGLERHIRPHLNGRDLTQSSRGQMVIDLFGLTENDLRRNFPSVYQHVLLNVKPERDQNNRARYRDAWWVFGELRRDPRPALFGLPRYTATVETAKHRIFTFLPAEVPPDNMLIYIASSEAMLLGVMQSRIHVAWFLGACGWLGVGNDPRYTKTQIFDPFPFPAVTPTQSTVIAEELDAHRKAAAKPRPALPQCPVWTAP
jgi:hypothetical protein